MRIKTRLFLGTALPVLALVGVQWWLHQRQLHALEREIGKVATSVGRDVLAESLELLAPVVESVRAGAVPPGEHVAWVSENGVAQAGEPGGGHEVEVVIMSPAVAGTGEAVPRAVTPEAEPPSARWLPAGLGEEDHQAGVFERRVVRLRSEISGSPEAGDGTGTRGASTTQERSFHVEVGVVPGEARGQRFLVFRPGALPSSGTMPQRGPPERVYRGAGCEGGGSAVSVDLCGRRALVTGASSGIGTACAEIFAAAGVHVALVARRAERLRGVAEGLRRAYGVEVRADVLDVRDRAAVAGWHEALPDPWRELDLLLANAGLSRGLEPLQRGLVDDWEEMVDTNLKGLLYVTRAVLPGMVERGRGHVIHIGSIAGHEVYPGGNVYCATKHAVTALTRALAVDTLGTGVRVSSVDPGMVETEFSLVRFHGDQERADAVYAGLQPLTPRDVAEAVLFCATRPAHANVREMILLPSAQAGAAHVKREG